MEGAVVAAVSDGDVDLDADAGVVSFEAFDCFGCDFGLVPGGAEDAVGGGVVVVVVGGEGESNLVFLEEFGGDEDLLE